MEKRVSIFLFALMAATVVLAHDFSAVSPSGHTLYYNYLDGQEGTRVEVVHPSYPDYHTYYGWISGDLIIPQTVSNGAYNYVVRSIGFDAFSDCNGLTSVQIPNSITNITAQAFWYCTGLTELTLPNSITQIERHAFCNCTGLRHITFSNNLTTIGECAFALCRNLEDVVVPASADNIGAGAFLHVRHIEYHGNTAGAPWGACCMNGYLHNGLYYADSSKQRLIGSSVGLTDVEVPTSVTAIGDSAFMEHLSLSSITIPATVRSIGYGAFSGCTHLSSVAIPDGVDTILGSSAEGKAAAFYQARHIEYHGHAAGAPWGACAMNGYSDGEFYYSDSTMKHLTGCIPGLTDVEIPEGVEYIEARALAGLGSLRTLVVPNSVAVIRDQAFANCRYLTDVVLGSGLDSMGNMVFDNNRVHRLVSRNPIPPIAINSTFSGISRSIQVEVPSEGRAAYSTAPGWREFKCLWSEGISTADDATAATIRTRNGSIEVEGAEGQPILVTDMLGRSVSRQLCQSHSTSISCPKRGCYLVQIGRHPAQKVMVW